MVLSVRVTPMIGKMIHGNVVTVKEDESDAQRIIHTCALTKHVLVGPLNVVKRIATHLALVEIYHAQKVSLTNNNDSIPGSIINYT